MGDISTEPSMEEILSSIKRIIAEEGDGASTVRSRRPRNVSAEPGPAPTGAEDSVLELSEAVGAPEDAPRPRAHAPAAAEPSIREAAARVETILSERAAEASRQPLETLSRMIVRPDVPGSDTLEGMVREMLKPMLRDWLDTHLPGIVEAMVAKEIARISGR
jgi:cell pole-organizing protein PopZ